MPAQTGYYDTLKSVAGKVFTYLASITLTGTEGKTITVTQDTFLDEAVAMSSKAPKESPTFTGTPAAPVPADNTATTQLATTAFAKSQDAVLKREPDQAVNLTAAAIAALKNTHSTVYSNTTNSFLCGIAAALPTWTPAATQILRNKWAANVGYKLECLVTSGVFRLTLNATTYDSAVPGGGAASNLVAGTKHHIIAVPTVGSTQTTVSFFLDGVLLSTTAAQDSVDVTTTQDMYTGGTSAATYAMTVYNTYDYNRALTAAEVLDLYRNVINFADKYGSQTSLVTNGTAWTGATGATPPTGWTVNTGAIFTIFDSGDGAPHNACLKMAHNGTNNSPELIQTFAAVIGKRYRVELDAKHGDGTSYSYYIGSTSGMGEYVTAQGITTAGWVTYKHEFVATTTLISINVRPLVSVASTYELFDEVKCYEIGATLALEPEGIGLDKWYDSSSNQLTASYPALGWSLTRQPNKKRLKQPTPTAETTAVTLTIAKLLTGIITATHTAGATQAYTLPTGALCDAWPAFGIDDYFEWILINLSAAAADTVTVTADTGHTIVGNPIVQSAHSSTGGVYGNSSLWRTKKTAADTFVSYRVA